VVIGNHDGKSASDRIGGRAPRRMRTHLRLRLCAAEMTARLDLCVHKGYAPTSGHGSHQVSPVAHAMRGMDMAATRDRATGHAPMSQNRMLGESGQHPWCVSASVESGYQTLVR
jgi:hypothetical protein